MEGLLIFQKLQATKSAACSKIDTKSKQTYRRIHFWDITVCHWKKMQTIRRNVIPSSLNVNGSQNTCNTFLPTVKNRSPSDAASYPRRLHNSKLNQREGETGREKISVL